VDGEHIEITERRRGSPIDKVVSELMIQVNSRWAGQLSAAGVAAIYRSQNNGKVRMSTTPAPHQGLGVRSTPGPVRPCGVTWICSINAS